MLIARQDRPPKLLDLPPRAGARVSASIPAAVAFAHPDRKVRIEASFASGGVIGDGGPTSAG